MEPDEDEEDEEEGELDVVGSIDPDNSKTIVIDESVVPMPELVLKQKKMPQKNEKKSLVIDLG